MFYQTVLLSEFQNTEITNVGSLLSFNLCFVSHVSGIDLPISFTLGSREQGAGRGLLLAAEPCLTNGHH
jgi:hypothetical protein